MLSDEGNRLKEEPRGEVQGVAVVARSGLRREAAEDGEMPGDLVRFVRSAERRDPSRGSFACALTGLLECAACGSKLLGSGGFYRCMSRNTGCGKTSVSARQLEDAIDRLVVARQAAGLAVDTVAAEPIDQAQRAELLAGAGGYQADVARLSANLATACTDTASRAIMTALDALDAKSREVDVRLAALVPETASARSYSDLLADDDFHARWLAGELTGVELAELHDLFAAYFEAIQVAPRSERTKTLDPRRIKVRWR